MTETSGILTHSGEPFATGAAVYFDVDPRRRDRHARIYVPFQPEGAPSAFLALLDTGASYCILNEEAASQTRAHLTGSLDQVELRTPYGLVRGDLYSHRIRLIAAEGEPLDFDAIVFIPPEWNGPCFIGYTGALDRLRFAVDPRKNRFFFGPSD